MDNIPICYKPQSLIVINSNENEIIAVNCFSDIKNYNVILFKKNFKSNVILYFKPEKNETHSNIFFRWELTEIHIDFNQMFNIEHDAHTGSFNFHIKAKNNDGDYQLIEIFVNSGVAAKSDCFLECEILRTVSFIPNFADEKYNKKFFKSLKRYKNDYFDFNTISINTDNPIIANKTPKEGTDNSELPF